MDLWEFLLVTLQLAAQAQFFAFEVSMTRFAGDVDKCLEFLLDTEEGSGREQKSF